LAFAGCFLQAGRPCAAQVVINEFDVGMPDWVELRNLGPAPVSLAGWTLSAWYATGSSLVTDPSLSIGSSVVLAPGATVVFEELVPAGTPGTVSSCAIGTGFNWNWDGNRSVVLALRDGSGSGIDYVFRNRTGVFGTPNLPPGLSWSGAFTQPGDVCYRNRNQDTHAAADWSAGPTGTPCSPNPGQTPVRPVTLLITTQGGGQATIGITTSPSHPLAEFYGLYSAMNFTPTGSGPFFGIGVDAIPWLFQPLIPNSPFHSRLDANGALTITIPPGVIPVGLFVEGVILLLAPSGPTTSNVVEVQF
jgi:hypothetical protein